MANFKKQKWKLLEMLEDWKELCIVCVLQSIGSKDIKFVVSLPN